MSGTLASALQAKAEPATARPDLHIELVESRIPCEKPCSRTLTLVVGTHVGPGTIDMLACALDEEL